MAGVPGVFWRSPVVFWGPSTHNSTLVPGKTHTSKNWPIFPLCMWKWGESAACGQARLWRPNGPQCAKSPAVWQSPSSRTEKLRTFSKKILSDFFLGPTGVLARVCAQTARALLSMWGTRTSEGTRGPEHKKLKSGNVCRSVVSRSLRINPAIFSQ